MKELTKFIEDTIVGLRYNKHPKPYTVKNDWAIGGVLVNSHKGMTINSLSLGFNYNREKELVRNYNINRISNKIYNKESEVPLTIKSRAYLPMFDGGGLYGAPRIISILEIPEQEFTVSFKDDKVILTPNNPITKFNKVTPKEA